jgi:NAD(P)-dependent dehydrogenase (short-subunit alcohol dehydrogenase family)
MEEPQMGIAAVTGSASGIGAAVRERLEKDGDRVIGVDVAEAEVQADLSTPDGRQRAIDGVREAAGGALDRLVLCAGLGNQIEDLALIASVNYFGAVDVLDGLLEAMQVRPGAAAVAVCSNSAQFAPFDDHPYVVALLDHDEPRARDIIAKENGFLAYSGSKHALSRAVRRRAGPWGHAGVRLNGIAPGATDTPMLRAVMEDPVWGKGVEGLDIPLGRRAQPAEIAGVVAFLLGPEAGYVHGAIVYADGGNDAMVRPERF